MICINKQELRELIIQQLKKDQRLLLQAASTAHAAATHAENVPDSKYETLSVEASYIAQGQANRAQEISLAIDRLRSLELKDFTPDSSIRLGALVLLEDGESQQRLIFLGPAAGGMKLNCAGTEIMLITPESPLGRELLGKKCGDDFALRLAGALREYEILALC